MTEVGYAALGIIPSFDGFERNLVRGTSGPMTAAGRLGGTTFGDSAGKSAGSRFGGAFKTAAKASLIGLGALGVGAFKLAGDAVAAASDLEESTNKVRQVFGKGAEDVFRFSEKAADALGQTNQQARDAAATFGLFGNIAGLSDRKSAKFATRMTTLASDLASFHNTEPEQAVEALGAALRGEAEPIRSFGVLLDEATLKAEALRIGLLEPVKDKAKIQGYQVDLLKAQKEYNEVVGEFGPKSLEALDAQADLGLAQDRLTKATEGTIPQLTQQQKVLAAQSAVFRQTEVAQGDFARTSDGLANQQRRLKARFEDAKAELGKGLLPIMTDAATFLLDKGIPAFEDFSTWFSNKGIPAFQDATREIEPLVKGAKELAGWLNDLPKSVKIGGLAGLAALIGASKLRGGNGGALGTAGKVLGMTKPVPVFVTNGGALGAGGGKLGKGGFFALTGPVTLAVAGTIASKEAGVLPGLPYMPDLSSDESKIRFASNAYKVAEAIGLVETAVRGVPEKWNTVFNIPGLDEALDKIRVYDGILEGIPRRVVTEFVQNVTRNNTVEEWDNSGGKTPSGTNIIINGDIRPNDYDGFMSDLDRRRQRNELDGRRP